jgi:hypothetical protein
MKDFHDIHMMIGRFEFDGATMQRALQRTFQNRNTNLPDEGHVIFSAEFAQNKAVQWSAFNRKIKRQTPMNMEEVTADMKGFFLPILSASQQGLVFGKKWKNRWM